MNLSPRQMVFAAVLFGVPVASFFMVFRPQNREIAKTRSEIAVKRDMLDKLRTVTSQAPDLVKTTDEIRQSIMAVEGRLPNSNQLDSVLRDVATIATKNGLRVPKFSKNPQTQEAGTAKEQPLDVEIVGEFDGFYKFLLEVEKLPRILRLTDMKLERVQDKEQDGLVRASLKISIYYQQGQTLADLFPEQKAGQASAEPSKSTGAASQVNGQSATASTGVNP